MYPVRKVSFPLVFITLALGACSSSDGTLPLTGGDSGLGVGNVADTVDDLGDATEQVSGGDTGGDTTGADNVGTTGGTDVLGAAAIEGFAGEWTTGCIPLDAGSPFFRTDSISVVGARVQWNFAIFSDSNCTIPESAGLVLNGSTVQQTATTVPTGNTSILAQGVVTEVDFHFEQATVDNRPLPDEDFLGREDFEERIDFQIIFFQGDSVYFGDTSLEGSDATSPDTRPTEIDFTRLFFMVQ